MDVFKRSRSSIPEPGGRKVRVRSSAITQFYVPLVSATGDPTHRVGGDNYRLKRLNPAAYRLPGLYNRAKETFGVDGGDGGERRAEDRRTWAAEGEGERARGRPPLFLI